MFKSLFGFLISAAHSPNPKLEESILYGFGLLHTAIHTLASEVRGILTMTHNITSNAHRYYRTRIAIRVTQSTERQIIGFGTRANF